MSGAIRALHFAARFSVIRVYFGQMLMIVAALTVVPAVVSFATGNGAIGVRYIVVIAAMALLGWAGSRQKLDVRLQKNEALVITALAFIVPPLFFSWVLMGYGIGFIDALFETVSGVTTTGLSTLATVEGRPAAFHFGRAWMQWVGGLGVVILTVAMLLEPGAATRTLGAEKREFDDVAGGARSHARNVLIVYTALTVAGIALLVGLGAAPFDAIVTALAAISTGGFSNYDDSLSGFQSVGPRIGATAICFVGAIGFYVFYRGRYGRWRSMFMDRQAQTLLLACILSTAALYAAFVIAGDAAGSRRVEHAALMAISAQSTAGFSTIAVADLSAAAQLVMIMSMFFGGSLGSTAGGIKLLRVLIMYELLLTALRRTMTPPSTHIPVRLDGRTIAAREIEAALAIVVGSAIIVAVSWFVFLAYGHDPMPSLFEVVSAFGTAGLSASITGPNLDPVLKLVLSFAMIAGRVETVAILVLLLPATWFGKRRSVT